MALKPLLAVLLSYIIIFLLITSVVSAIMRPRLGVNPQTRSNGVLAATTSRSSSSTASQDEDHKVFHYTQTLDHYNYRPDSFFTFQQRYIVNSRYWGGANNSSPIFVYLGAEGPIDDEIHGTGFLDDNRYRFNALQVYIEHRYYGKSVPFGSLINEVFDNTTTLGYLTSAQALADYADIIVSLKRNLSAENCPVIVFGGSYGGMLAAWFRLKYPHISLGALASSAPILDTDNIMPEDFYYRIVSKDFQEESESCYSSIRQSWSIIDSHDKNDLSFLTQKFKLCNPLNTSSELKGYLEMMYGEAAQYDYVGPQTSRVNRICHAIDRCSKGTDVLTRILAGVVAYEGEQPCYDVNKYNSNDQSGLGWYWQTCTDLISPFGRPRNNTMFQISPFDLKEFIEGCRNTFDATLTPRPHWIATEFGGHNIKLVLQHFGSNIIFSNGLRDPYSAAGVLQNISDSVVAIYTTRGSHCLDIQAATEHDPIWLVRQRSSEAEIMEGWLMEYNTMRGKANSAISKGVQRGGVSPSHFMLIVVFVVLFCTF